ncbi:sigma-70 family RNA polymerase sigma factor [Bacillus rubiinfantis]|uniref:sigma-70 family RNA polymerase sigma factor n=1 Tax=Bacillus rubiinfantis TaxID=1499680 RepID=UPI0005AA65E6|nr:sigma-70 family RNA polymerase sigma factor [Bacillus rubiinfantis]
MESFEQLVEQYEPMIHHLINSLHIYKNKEEFFQDGLIALWEAKERFDPKKGKFSSYAYSYMKGRLLTSLKVAVRDSERNVAADETFWEYEEDTAAFRPFPLEELGLDCDSLTTNQRKWLEYVVWGDLSIRDIAAREGVSISAVKNWRAGARAKFKVAGR